MKREANTGALSLSIWCVALALALRHISSADGKSVHVEKLTSA
jgi:hypothetical protein